MNKVQAGLFFFMSVRQGDHAAFNRWHSYEHIPEFQTMPSEVDGRRYVATPALIAARSPAEPALAPAQYLIPYYHQGPAEESLEKRRVHNRWVEANSPAFTGKTKMRFAGAFDFVRGRVAPRLRISPEALLYRPHTGVYATLQDLATNNDAKVVEEWYDQYHFPDMLSVKGFTGVWRFRSRPHPDFPNPPDRFLNLYFLDEEPAKALADLRARHPGWIAAGRGPRTPRGPLLIESAFQTIVNSGDAKYDWFDR